MTAMVAAPRQRPDPAAPREIAAFGMWVFLSSEVLFFGVLFFGYLITRLHYPDAFAAASRHTDVVLGTVNTALLLTSSLTMALAVLAIERDRRRTCMTMLCATFVLGTLFAIVKCVEYAHDVRAALLPWAEMGPADVRGMGARLFFLLYFVTTGMHALHLLIGLAVVATMIALVARARIGPERTTPLEVAALYWHLVDVVWIFLYPLLYLVARS